MKLRLCILLGSLFCILSVGAAQAAYAPSQPRYAARAPETLQGPAAMLDQGLKTLIGFVGQREKPDQRQIADFLEREIVPYFDFAYMARWSGGKMWRRMSPEQRQWLESELKQNFLGTLARRLTAYGGQQVRVLRSRPGRGNQVSVGVALSNPGGYPARLDFRFYRTENSDWKVFDVAANGSSALVHYRKYFRNLMPRRAIRSGGYPGGRYVR